MPVALRPLPSRTSIPLRVVAKAATGHRSAALVLSNLVWTLPALAAAPNASDLSSLSYEASSAASSTARDLSLSIPPIDVSGSEDAWPLIAGLAVGILLAGAGVRYAFGGFGGPQLKAANPQQALKMLENDANAQIIDIRSKMEVREAGVPSLRSTRKSLISVPYQPPQGPTPQTSAGTVSVGWAQRIARMKKVNGEGSQIILLDTDGTVAGAAARELAAAVPQAKGILRVDAESWKQADLPWKASPQLPALPSFKLPSISLPSTSGDGEGSAQPIDSTTVAVAGAAGGALLLFSQLPQLLEIIGVAYVLQFGAQRLLFAESRKKTLAELEGFQKRISAGDFTTDLRRVADAALEVPEVASSRDLESKAADTTQQLAQSLSKGAPSSNGKPKEDEIAQNRKQAQEWIKKWRDSSKVAA